MNIRDVMTPDPKCIVPGDSIQNAARNSTEWFENVERYLKLDPVQ